MKHDFSSLSDFELQRRYNKVSEDLNGGKTYWYAEEVGRDHDIWKALKQELNKRVSSLDE